MSEPAGKHLGELRVLEVSCSLAGALAGRMAADLGARVIVLAARPRSEWLDQAKDFVDTEPALLASRAAELAADVDAVIWDDLYGGAGIFPAELRARAAFSLELCGSHAARGPWSEFSLLAESGLAYLTGYRDGPPVALPGHQVAMLTGCHGFAALSSAVANGAAGEPAAHIAIAAVELLAGLHQFSLIDWVCNRRIRKRNGRRWANNHPIGNPTPCKDGHLALCPATDEMFFRLCVLLEQPELAEDPRFRTTTLRFENADALDEIMEAYFADRTRQELFTTGNELGAPVAPVLSPDEILADANLEHRGAWDLRGDIRVPALGLERLPSGTVLPPSGGPKPAPLAGIRVVEFTKVWAGPLAGRALADIGAEVVRIEAPFSRGPAVIPPGAAVIPAIYPGDEPGEHPWNRQGIQNILNRSRKSVCLDIKHPEARQLAFDLCARADIVIENNRPGSLARSGLGYEDIAAVNPGVIFAGMSGYGAIESLYRDYPAYGPVTEAMGGMVWWIRDPARPEVPLPTGTGWPDPIIAAMAIARIGAALNARMATGRGAFLDLSQVECTVAFLGDVFAKWQEAAPPARSWELAYDARDFTVPLPDGTYLACTAAETTTREQARRIAASQPDVAPLRAEGIAAALDRSAPDVFASPELSTFWVDLDHTDTGSFAYDGNPLVASGTRLPVTVFPSLGQDNAEVLASWLGLSPDAIEGLAASGAIATQPRPPIVSQR